MAANTPPPPPKPNKKTYPAVEILRLSHSAVYCLSVYHEHRQPTSMMDTPATLQKRPPSLPLNTLKLVSLPLVSGASLCLVLGPHPHRQLGHTLLNYVAPEGRAYLREKMSHPAYKPPLRFVLMIRLQKGGCICGTLWYIILTVTPE